MTFEISWRNPAPPRNTKSSVQRVASEDGRAVYLVCGSDRVFELILGGAFLI